MGVCHYLTYPTTGIPTEFGFSSRWLPVKQITDSRQVTTTGTRGIRRWETLAKSVLDLCEMIENFEAHNRSEGKSI